MTSVSPLPWNGRRNIVTAQALSCMNTSNPPPYPGDKARGAEVILRRPWERYVFFGALAGMILLLIVLALMAGLHS